MRWLLITALTVTTACAPHAPPALTGPKWLSANGTDSSLDGWHVIFVAGFLNELIPGYFTDNIEVVRALGATTSIVHPPSDESLDDDVALIEKEIDANAGKKIVLFGHSKGGAGVLLTALRDPELVLHHKVEAVIVLQGSIGGSAIADDLSGLPILKRGMEALTPHRCHADFKAALKELHARLFDDDRKTFFSRIFYVRSSQHTATLALELAITKGVLDKGGANDGLLNENDMELAEGVDLGIIDSDHAGLTVASFLATTTPDERRTFTHALFREVGRRLQWKTQ